MRVVGERTPGSGNFPNVTQRGRRLMKKTFVLPTLLLAALAQVSCGDDGIEDLVDQFIDERNDQAEVLCDCYEQLNFSDRSTCLRENGQVLPAQRRCIIDAFERNESASKDYLNCHLPLEEELTACVDDRLTCDNLSAASPCIDDYNIGSRDCISLPASIERAYTECF
jgi:hypothetical protein